VGNRLRPGGGAPAVVDIEPREVPIAPSLIHPTLRVPRARGLETFRPYVGANEEHRVRGRGRQGQGGRGTIRSSRG